MEGEVLLNGKNIATMKRWEVASKIGYVPQEQETIFPFTVQQVVLAGRTPYIHVFSSPSSKDVAIANEAMERVGIAGLKDKRFNELSGGEKQLVLLARVLAQQPKILLLDEPTAHLDFRNKTITLRFIQRLVKEGLSVIMTSHVPDDAFTYSDRVALMHNGQFIASGCPEEVLTEDNLKKAYDIAVKLYTVVDAASSKRIKLCIPA